MCDLDVTGEPLIFSVIHSATTLTRMLSTFDLSCEEYVARLKWNWTLVLTEELFVYYESIKRELNKRLIFECRCDARLKAKAEGSTRLAYTRWREEP